MWDLEMSADCRYSGWEGEQWFDGWYGTTHWLIVPPPTPNTVRVVFMWYLKHITYYYYKFMIADKSLDKIIKDSADDKFLFLISIVWFILHCEISFWGRSGNSPDANWKWSAFYSTRLIFRYYVVDLLIVRNFPGQEKKLGDLNLPVQPCI